MIMRAILFLVVLCCTITEAVGQIKLTSPMTQYWPTMFTTEYKEVDRTVWFEADKITIVSETPTGKEFEALQVISFENKNTAFVFHCTSRDGTKAVSVVLPYRRNAKVIDVYRISPKTMEEVQVRLHLE